MGDKAMTAPPAHLLHRLNVIQERRLAEERTDKDYAIEFGGYLANAAERFMQHHNEKVYPTAENADVGVELWRGLKSAIYEFRKRAKKAGEKNSD